MKAKPITRLAGVLVMGSIAAAAFAGAQSSYSVTIQPGGAKPYASGDLGWVRNSWYANEYIGCSANATSGECYAQNLVGAVASCSTTNPAMLQVIYAIHGDSNLLFSWNPDGTCRDIRVLHYSWTAPK